MTWPIPDEVVARAASLRTLSPGAPLHALEPRLDAQPGAPRLLKYRFSAFTNNPSDPETTFRRAGIDTIIVAGVASSICCESTARDAIMRDFKVFMPHDAVTASTPDQHFTGLGSVMQVFADVRRTDALVDLIETR
jgi:ureidoacrylate peracid hydrolase